MNYVMVYQFYTSVDWLCAQACIKVAKGKQTCDEIHDRIANDVALCGVVTNYWDPMGRRLASSQRWPWVDGRKWNSAIACLRTITWSECVYSDEPTGGKPTERIENCGPIESEVYPAGNMWRWLSPVVSVVNRTCPWKFCTGSIRRQVQLWRSLHVQLPYRCRTRCTAVNMTKTREKPISLADTYL